MSDEILDIAHGNVRLAAEIRELLRALLDHQNGKVREMARDVLDGASLRQMAASSVYGDEIGADIETLWQKYQEMAPEERAELEQGGRDRINPRRRPQVGE
ncbi:hypothetical protein FHR83_002034 [Actinoplanes campanulatus]|uniref:Uncharacterized protein n=1 Tax=Actinoplanes campanulatus TaxID=113559 RepID=A0A7W5ADL3_9ACTN|nr:hypothetical protein [Actinoplanes campanulatus]MBB3094382.1 hypothetical protein [Actinoplanes campanulatus]GGN20677.1 hypothetical protein GCM10010109_34470 [Actinoplanes campanulatus]GID35703.1 hypothetical protein Aca09nite_22090 [Actinoplanes campanulatus]